MNVPDRDPGPSWPVGRITSGGLELPEPRFSQSVTNDPSRWSVPKPPESAAQVAPSVLQRDGLMIEPSSFGQRVSQEQDSDHLSLD
jgi:hypothetical protein